MYEPASRHPNVAFLWPAMLAASTSEIAALFAKQFTSLALAADGEVASQPKWATPHRLALELKTVQYCDKTTVRLFCKI